MRTRLSPLASFSLLAVILGGCGGGSSSQGSHTGQSEREPAAIAGRTDVIGGTGETTASVPVSVAITADVGSLPPDNVLGYDVYRTPTAKDSDAVLIGSQKGSEHLLVFDNSLPIGERTDYKVVINYTTGQTAAGTPILKSESLKATNYATQTEPTENASVTPSSAGRISVSVPATLGADDYVLDVSADSTFNNKQRFTPSSKGPYSVPTDAPTQGAAVTFGSLNAAQAFPGVTTLYLRIGARDSRNGTSTSANPYVFTDPQQVSVP